MALHYGQTAPLDAFRHFDVVVVEPDHGFDPTAYAASSGGQSQLYAYVSMGEVLPSRAYYKALPADLRKGVNPDWESQVIDQANPQWPALLAEHIIRPLWEKGYRGFFFDTMDSFHLIAKTDAERARQVDGQARAIYALRDRFPGIRLVTNRGFEVLPKLRGIVRAVAAESLFRGWNQELRSYTEVNDADREWLSNALIKVRDELGIPAVAIDYVAPTQRKLARDTARKISALGITPWVTDPELSSVGIGPWEVMPRKVLVVFENPSRGDPALTEVQRFLFTPLQYLGLQIESLDLANDSLKPRLLADQYAGVVVWTRNAYANRHQEIKAFYRDIIDQKVPLVILNHFGITLDRELSQLLGVNEQTLPWNSGTPAVEFSVRDPVMQGEYPAAGLPNQFFRFNPASSAAPITLEADLGTNASQVWLELSDSQGRRSQAAAKTPWGAYAMWPYVVVPLMVDWQYRWVLEPISFLKAALRLPDLPVPDVTTATGRRILLTHVDGDGLVSRAEAPERPLAVELLQKEFWSKHHWPHTISVIEAEVAPHGLYPALSELAEKTLKQTFAMAHVEIASHTWSHPFIWTAASKGEKVDGRQVHLPVPNYRFNLEREINGSAQYINARLAPQGKRTRVLLWSGDCLPGEEAIATSDRFGLLAMNGGETIIAKSNASLTAVGPISARRGKLLQVLAPNQNENVYTNLWTSSFHAYRKVIETFEMTERPRRLKPIDIYYHGYVVTKPGGLTALREIYQWVQQQATHPLFVSDYVRIAQDFERFSVARAIDAPTQKFRVATTGQMQTARLPASWAARLDETPQATWAGWQQAEANEPVYLHWSGARTDVNLLAEGATRRAGAPRIVHTNARITQFERQANALSFTLEAYVPIELSLNHPAHCQLKSDGKALAQQAAPTNPSVQPLHRYTPGHRAADGSYRAMVSLGC